MKIKELLACVRELGMQGWVVSVLVLCSVLSTLAEGVGIGLILPIAQLMTSGNDPQTLIEQSRLWQYVDRAHAIFGLSVSLQTLFAACGLLLIFRQTVVYAREVFFNTVKFRLSATIRFHCWTRSWDRLPIIRIAFKSGIWRTRW